MYCLWFVDINWLLWIPKSKLIKTVLKYYSSCSISIVKNRAKKCYKMLLFDMLVVEPTLLVSYFKLEKLGLTEFCNEESFIL